DEPPTDSIFWRGESQRRDQRSERQCETDRERAEVERTGVCENLLTRPCHHVDPQSARALERMTAIADEMIPDVSRAGIGASLGNGACRADGSGRDGRLVEPGALGDSLHRMPVSIARRARHRGVRVVWIFTKLRLR